MTMPQTLPGISSLVPLTVEYLIDLRNARLPVSGPCRGPKARWWILPAGAARIGAPSQRGTIAASASQRERRSAAYGTVTATLAERP